jgi:hypothetical protein
LPKEIKDKFPPNTIMIIRKPLYRILKAGTHWWATYYKHHREKLVMATSTYNPYLLIIITKGAFDIVGMQTDNTLILGLREFDTIKKEKLTRAKFSVKPKKLLFSETLLIFNGCILTQKKEDIELRQKEQGKKLKTVNSKAKDP